METYESEYTLFMRQMMEKNPDWVREQQQGMARLWDRQLNAREQQDYREASEAPRAYPYDVNFG